MGLKPSELTNIDIYIFDDGEIKVGNIIQEFKVTGQYEPTTEAEDYSLQTAYDTLCKELNEANGKIEYLEAQIENEQFIAESNINFVEI